VTLPTAEQFLDHLAVDEGWAAKSESSMRQGAGDRTPIVGPPAMRAAAGWSATSERTRPG
jgi:hypothetical protein